jgi:hypothetical protein
MVPMSVQLSIEMQMQRELVGLGGAISVGAVGDIDKTKAKSKSKQAWE